MPFFVENIGIWRMIYTWTGKKRPKVRTFRRFFLQMGNQITHDPGGHAPDGVAPVEPHRDLYLAAVPRVIPGDPNRFIGERLRDTGDQVISMALAEWF